MSADRFWMRLAWALPKRLAYWCAIRVATRASRAVPTADALAERVEQLHAALRMHTIGLHGRDAIGCSMCGGKWNGDKEQHAADCLAAPTAPKEAA